MKPRSVKGHWELPGGGHENCPVVAMRSARSWPPVRPVCISGQGFYPLAGRCCGGGAHLDLLLLWLGRLPCLPGNTTFANVRSQPTRNPISLRHSIIGAWGLARPIPREGPAAARRGRLGDAAVRTCPRGVVQSERRVLAALQGAKPGSHTRLRQPGLQISSTCSTDMLAASATKTLSTSWPTASRIRWSRCSVAWSASICLTARSASACAMASRMCSYSDKGRSPPNRLTTSSRHV